MVRKPLSLAVAVLAVASACRSQAPAASPAEPAIFTLVLLRTGSAPPDLSDDEWAGLSERHAAFIAAEAAARRMLLAGPFGEDRAHGDLRGLFLYDEPDVAAALSRSLEDPTTRAGVFRQEAFPLATSSALRELPGLETARQEARAAAGEGDSGPDLRRYALLVAEDGETAARAVGHPALAPFVVLFGRLGPPRDGALLAVLAVDDMDEVRARLTIANEARAAFEVSEWFATPSLLDLPSAWGRASR